MDEVLKVINDGLLSLQRQLEWTKADKEKVENNLREAYREIDALKCENAKLKEDLSFYKPSETVKGSDEQ